MFDRSNFRDVPGRDVIGRDGERIGKAGSLFVDDRSGEPEWVTVNTGLFGMRESVVPLRDASLRGDEILVPYDKDTIKGAPNVELDDGHLSVGEEAELYRYYGRDYGDYGHTGMRGRPGYSDTDLESGEGIETESAHRGVPGSDEDAMTRSEERLRVGTERIETGAARLHKYVDTEEVQVTVPVKKERVVVEREPITDENRDEAFSGPDFTESEHEVITYEERPVVEKEAVPVERVRLTTETETEEETVSETLRKERIEEDTDPNIR